MDMDTRSEEFKDCQASAGVNPESGECSDSSPESPKPVVKSKIVVPPHTAKLMAKEEEMSRDVRGGDSRSSLIPDRSRPSQGGMLAPRESGVANRSPSPLTVREKRGEFSGTRARGREVEDDIYHRSHVSRRDLATQNGVRWSQDDQQHYEDHRSHFDRSHFDRSHPDRSHSGRRDWSFPENVQEAIVPRRSF